MTAVKDERRPQNNCRRLTAVDLFAGSGAVTEGLRQANFDVLGAVDIDPIASDTYKRNHPKVCFVERDIIHVDPAKDFAELPRKIDLLAVCAPCQPFSSRNKKRSKEDDRAALVLEAVKFARYFKPKVIFFENVPGLERNAVFEELKSSLLRLRYHVSDARILDAADLGVPQRRPRMFLVAARSKRLLPKLCSFGVSPRRTVLQAIGDLASPEVGYRSNLLDSLHFSRRHQQITLERLKHIPKDGGSRASLPDHLVLECHRKLENANHYPDSYGRMAWNEVAPTLTTGCTDLTKGRYAHPEEDRAITLREAARLQTFPDDYIFAGNAADIASQIGNAVPPQMMKAIASNFAQWI